MRLVLPGSLLIANLERLSKPKVDSPHRYSIKEKTRAILARAHLTMLQQTVFQHNQRAGSVLNYRLVRLLLAPPCRTLKRGLLLQIT